MVEERDTAQISDHTPDILLSRTSARQAQMNGESRAKGRSGVFLPRVSLALASTRLKKVKKENHSFYNLTFYNHSQLSYNIYG